MNWKAQTLPVIISGLPCRVTLKKEVSDTQDWSNLPQPPSSEIIRCSPLAQIKLGNYGTPTFLVHGTADELIPWQQSRDTWVELKKHGVRAELALIDGGPHVCDGATSSEAPSWKAVLRGYRFLYDILQVG
jgi:acetyl esterase/lipase